MSEKFRFEPQRSTRTATDGIVKNLQVHPEKLRGTVEQREEQTSPIPETKFCHQGLAGSRVPLFARSRWDLSALAPAIQYKFMAIFSRRALRSPQ